LSLWKLYLIPLIMSMDDANFRSRLEQHLVAT
jgi:hypothetical protein